MASNGDPGNPPNTDDPYIRYTIGEHIRLIDNLINEDYEKYDNYACRNQKFHVFFAHTAVLSGTVAILIALLQLTGFLPKELSLPWETIATLLSVTAVVTGMIWAVQRRWLLERYKAESLRILRFRALFQPDFLCGNTDRWKIWLIGEIARITSLEKEDLHHIINSGEYSPLPSSVNTSECDSNTIVAIAEYFSKNLIATQILYFRQKADEQESSDRVIKHLPHLLFFVGVVIVALHFILNNFIHEAEENIISNTLIFLGIALPVIGMGIRTYRSSHEFARSAAIFRSKENRLLEMESQIASFIKDQPGNKMQILSLLYICENLLEEEHYEWLRLMAETEWFL
jgi:hypothetical protein